MLYAHIIQQHLWGAVLGQAEMPGVSGTMLGACGPPLLLRPSTGLRLTVLLGMYLAIFSLSERKLSLEKPSSMFHPCTRQYLKIDGLS